MRASRKETVALSRIVPGQNPRRDFGDIDALAGAIAATGGQPVNPPVVVADGDVYRLVDGERRYRALRRLHGDQGTADVLVFDDYGEAEEAVAMMATDAKQELTEEERARGFQRMLLLGVEEHTIAKAARRRVSDVRKAASVASDAPEQATLDQMIAAAEFDGKDREAVLAAGPDKWQAKAETIRRRIERAKEDVRYREALEAAGIEVVARKPEGYRSVAQIYGLDSVGRRAGEAMEAHGDAVVAWKGSYWWEIGAPEGAEPEETEDERAARETDERRRAALTGLREALLRDIATTDVMPRTLRAAGRLRVRAFNWELNNLRRELVDGLGVSEDLADGCMASPMSTYELLQFVRQNNVSWWEWVSELVPAACDDNFQPSEEDMWLLELARCERERREAEGQDEEEDE